MNRKFIDPFKSVALPEVIEEYLNYGVAKCCAFNRRGTLLATGTEGGYIVIWDFETRGVAKVLQGHSAQDAQDGQQRQRSAALAATVTSLAWSRNGRYLLSGALDRRVMLWDVFKSEKLSVVDVSSGVTCVALSPRSPYRAVASLLSTPPVIIDLDKKEALPLASIDFKASGDRAGQEMVANMAHGVALLSRSGREVLLGQLRGTITIYDTDTQQVMDVIKLPAAVKVMSMSLNRQGTLLLVNCSDKAVRLYEVRKRRPDAPTFSSDQLKEALSSMEAGKVGSLLHSPEACMLQLSPNAFQNAVEKNQWRAAVFSGDCEHVVGAVASKSDHRVYIWSRLYGKLERILEGPRNESTADLAWHPTRSLLVTISGNGRVYLWAQVFDENWSAFAPDFQELDENQEYVEQEDEFDINEKPAPVKEGDQEDAEDEEVEVITRERLPVFSSDEEDEGREGSEEPLYWLPAEVNPLDSSAPGDKEEQTAKEDQEEASDESSEEEDTKPQQPEELILDRPRDRKRRVRFQDSYEEDDGEDDDELQHAAAAAAPAGAPRGGRGGGRGRGGRRGRPPKSAGVGAAPGRNTAGGGAAGMGGGYGAGGGVLGGGMGQLAGYPTGGLYGLPPAAGAQGGFGGPGNAFNPAPQQQQQQQQQMGPAGGLFGGMMMPGGQAQQQQQQWPGGGS